MEMGLDVKETLEVTKSEVASYANWFTSALRSPAFIARYARADETVANEKYAAFFVVLVVSALIGATIGAIIPERPPIKDRFTVAVVVVLVWYFISFLLHGVVRLFGGEGPMKVTIRAMMQVLALAYVVSNVVTLVIMSAAATWPLFRRALMQVSIDTPGDVLISSQLLLLLFYVPTTVRWTHGIRGVLVGTAIGVMGTVFAGLVVVVLLLQGAC